MKFLVSLYIDLQTLSDQMKAFFHDVIIGERLKMINTLSMDLIKELTQGKNESSIDSLIVYIVVLDDTLSPLTSNSRLNVKNLVIKQLIERCNETLHSVQDIPRMYRKTNREVNLLHFFPLNTHFHSSSGSNKTIELHSNCFSSSAKFSSGLSRKNSNR